MSRRSKSAVLVTAAVAVLATAAGTAAANGRLPVLDRSAKGQVDAYGGAARERGDQSRLIADSIASGRARNVILLIGDGMGDSEITVARNYLRGAGGAFPGIDALPLTGQMTHYSVNQTTGKPDYTPDSASTGTAWSTGVKTYDNAISVDRHGKAYPTLLEQAKRAGFATGDITTSEIQDATPAVEVSHISQRACYGPVETTAKCPEAAKEKGGRGSISEQLLDTRPDVTMGGGSTTFAQTATAGPWKNQTLAQQAQARGFTYITAKADLAGVNEADQQQPLLALFAPGNMPVRFAPYLATAGAATQPAGTCSPEPTFSPGPELRTMTQKSIDLLSHNKAGRKNGFFLQVESASIDKRDHAADACGQIGETEQMDEAVKTALDFARRDGHTLVIATADHAHSSQIVDGDTPGLTAKLLTKEGAEMIVAYGTAAAGASQQHTGTQLRVAGYGPGAANLVGLIDQTDLHFIIDRALGLD